jgi:hypothetical protein
VPGNPLSAYSDITQDVTKNVFYWSRVAVIVAQGSGMHRRYALDSTDEPRFVCANAQQHRSFTT